MGWKILKNKPVLDIKKAMYIPNSSDNHKYKDLTPGKIYDVIEMLKWANEEVSRIKIYNDYNECGSYHIEVNNRVIFIEAIEEYRNGIITEILS